MNSDRQGSFTYVSGSIATGGDVGIQMYTVETLRWSVSLLREGYLCEEKDRYFEWGWQVSPAATAR